MTAHAGTGVYTMAENTFFRVQCRTHRCNARGNSTNLGLILFLSLFSPKTRDLPELGSCVRRCRRAC